MIKSESLILLLYTKYNKYNKKSQKMIVEKFNSFVIYKVYNEIRCNSLKIALYNRQVKNST